ncbi:MAG: FtsX-like permease family protein [Prosthecobacter sp.]|nr:FtsX-like permease family protein [Prosthecobacter sp.]
MTLASFILQSARHYWRGHIGLLFGAFLASAVLSGSLLVGDSVRASLRRVAHLRLGQVESGVLGGDRWFSESLARGVKATPLILAVGSTTAANAKVRVNSTQVLGIEDSFWKLSASGKPVAINKNSVALNEPLARKLQVKVGDTVLVRLERPSAISRDAPLSGSTNQDVSLRRQVSAIVSAEDFGAFQVIASQITPDTVFVPLADLQIQLEMDTKVNALLSGGESAQSSVLSAQMEKSKTLADFGLKLTRVKGARQEWEISTDRVFLDRSLATKLRTSNKESYGVLTYLVNGLKSATGGTPYSMITAAEASPAPTGSEAPNSIVITQWLAEDHQLAVGGKLDIHYFVVGLGRELKQASATFTVAGILPMTDPNVNRAWTPEFPGVSDVDNCRDWEPGIPMDMKAIRDKDEKYWDDYKGTPKGFIRLEEGQKLWSNRFGNLTAIRFPDTGQDENALRQALTNSLNLADIGLTPRPFRAEAAAAAKGSVDFGGLFIGLSMFLIAAALVFAALLFLFTLERRAAQVGLLMAVGWPPKMVRRTWLGEAGVIALAGVVLGVFGGSIYTKLALRGLRGAWSGASQGLPLVYEASPVTMIGAGVGSLVVVLLTLWWAARRLFKTQPRELLGGEISDPSSATASIRHLWLGKLWLPLCLMGTAALLVGAKFAKAPEAVAGMFFGSGTLLLIAGLLLARRWMRRDHAALAQTLWQIGTRNISRRPSRSLAVIGMMAGGIFLVTAVNAFRMSAGDATAPESGTGGFALIGESSLPVYEDLTSKAGLEAFGLDEKLMAAAKVVPFRLREGDDASCLNLNRAQKPVLAGVDPAKLTGRFTFTSGPGWQDLTNDVDMPAAVADQATAMWGLGKGIGDTVDYQDAAGNTFKVKLVGLLAGSVLQGKMIISETAFLAKYPDAAGYRSFLIDAPPAQAAEVSAHLTRQLEQRGLALEPARQRLEAFLSVQNTYIGIFTILGGLGVLLGTAGLGILVARHVLERRGELGLMQALGFLPAALRRLVLGEHVALLLGGVLLGIGTAAIAVWPNRTQPGSLPVGWLGLLIGGVLIFGILVCAAAVSLAIRGRLIEAIRRE